MAVDALTNEPDQLGFKACDILHFLLFPQAAVARKSKLKSHRESGVPLSQLLPKSPRLSFLTGI
jgi:hypothetical protein